MIKPTHQRSQTRNQPIHLFEVSTQDPAALRTPGWYFQPDPAHTRAFGPYATQEKARQASRRLLTRY